MISEPILIALIAAAFPTISIGISAYFNYRASSKVQSSVDEVHKLTNSAATDAQAKISELHKTINRLEKVISKH
jgi:hypothetical protein